jgi:4-hydroxybenzoyl-CoA reductase subunit beta
VTNAAAVKEKYRGLYQAAMQVATPHLRNMGTLGGNLCLDTRCTYYNQNYEWRKAIDFCMKIDGEICWVATASKRCLAVSSTDTAPALISLGAKVRLVSAEGEREVPLENLYRNDGIDYLARKHGEILSRSRACRRTTAGRARTGSCGAAARSIFRSSVSRPR